MEPMKQVEAERLKFNTDRSHRTPIQVERSPQTSRPTEQWNSSKQAQDPDPCSPTLGTAQTPMKISETIIASQNSDKPSRDPETLRSSGSKFNRQKACNKVLGTSPLTILQDDNSPGTLINGKDLKERAVPETGRFMETGGAACEQSQGHDKESQHFALMES
ncbi:hypothetical protein U0070_017720 [Myodes glareolus]|uniref:Prolactin receptor n=1 Tax=Myodes glareolus TaxID=447135 RepID=A0AAW0K6G4_MYOGA